MKDPGSSPELPQHNLAAVNEAVAAAVGERPAIIFRDRRLTHADLVHRTRSVARTLRDRGVGVRQVDREARGARAAHESDQDHIAICLHNGNEYLETMLGAFKARAVPINVNYRYVADELRYVLGNSIAASIVYHSKFAPKLAEVLPDLPNLRSLIQVEDESGNGLLAGAEWYEDLIADAADTPLEWADDWSPNDLYLLYTGGTTGLPKAVLWRQADIYRTALGGRSPVSGQPWQTLNELVEFVATEPSPHVALPSSPFMHGAGHWTALMALNQGGTVVIQDQVDRLNAADVCSVIARTRVTYLQLVGDAFGRPIAHEMERGSYDLSSLRIIRTGGTSLSVAVKRRLLDRLPHLTIMDSMGSSEGGGQGVQSTRAGDDIASGTFSPAPGSVIVSSTRDRILHPGEDEIGWLAKWGDVALGYLGDPEKTAQTFQVVAGERMAIPGDRARWSENGTIELLGRDSTTINSGGEKIFAEEVEAAISAHPDVNDVVISSRPSERWGQEVVAIVCLCSGSSAAVSDLEHEAGLHVARFKLPKAWLIVGEIRRSPAGKADRRWANRIAVTESAGQSTGRWGYSSVPEGSSDSEQT